MPKFPIITKSSGEHKNVICNECGANNGTKFVTETRQYKTKNYLYIKSKALPYCCDVCSRSYNMVGIKVETVVNNKILEYEQIN